MLIPEGDQIWQSNGKEGQDLGWKWEDLERGTGVRAGPCKIINFLEGIIIKKTVCEQEASQDWIWGWKAWRKDAKQTDWLVAAREVSSEDCLWAWGLENKCNVLFIYFWYF